MSVSSSPPILNVHTPTTSFAISFSFGEDTLQTLFDKLSRKYHGDADGNHVGPGWLKYEWSGTVWDLDDESDYTIFVWRQKSAEHENGSSPTLHMHNPNHPASSANINPAYYLAKRAASLSPARPARPRSRARSHSVKSGKSRRSTPVDDGVPKFKKDFIAFHSENGVRTVTGSIGPIPNVRMLLKNGYRHVYISRSFALKNGFILGNTTPGFNGYSGLVNIGQWPVKVGKTETIHSVYLSEEPHFDCILGRSFMERRGIKTDPTDLTNIVCLDTGEKIDCELVIIRDGKGEIVTVT